jgi:hypothetical protein
MTTPAGFVGRQSELRVLGEPLSNAGGAVWGAGKLFGGHQLGPWSGFAVRCGYAVVLTGLAAWRLRRRDA